MCRQEHEARAAQCPCCTHPEGGFPLSSSPSCSLVSGFLKKAEFSISQVPQVGENCPATYYLTLSNPSSLGDVPMPANTVGNRGHRL